VKSVIAGLFVAAICMALVSSSPADESGGNAYTELPGEAAQLDVAQEIASSNYKAHQLEYWLDTADARKEREVSRYAYRDIPEVEAKQLIVDEFPDVLSAMNSDPGRLLSGKNDVDLLNPSVAIIGSGEGARLIDSSIALADSSPGMGLQPVDLSLSGPLSAPSIQPENALVKTVLPTDPADAIKVGQGKDKLLIWTDPGGLEGLTSAEHFGNKGLFYPEIAPDSDLVAAPVASGVELLFVLRSPKSPERIPIHFENGSSSSVRLEADGSIRLVDSDGTEIGAITPPYALDAQGVEVPTKFGLDNNGSFEVEVPHTENDVAYPILVDPVFENWQDGPDGNNTRSWYHGYNYDGLDQWAFSSNSSNILGMKACYSAAGRSCWGSGKGLYMYTKPDVNYPSNSFGQFSYTAPGGSAARITRADIGPEFQNRYNCTNSERPTAYFGLWRPGQSEWIDLQTHGTGMNGLYKTIGSGNISASAGIKSVIAGTGTGAGTLNLACWRDHAMGGAYVTLAEDGTAPSVSVIQPAVPVWIGGNSQPGIQINSTESGLGIKSVEVTGPYFNGEGEENTSKTWPLTLSCTGVKSDPCPLTWSVGSGNNLFNAAEMPDGEHQMSVEVKDILGNPSTPKTVTVRVDNTAPTIEFSGGSTEHPSELTGEQLDLSFSAYDGIAPSEVGEDENSPGNPWDLQSGITRVQVLVDGISMSLTSTSCPAGNCEKHGTVPFAYTAKSPGRHTVRVIVRDGALNETTRDFVYSVPSAPPTQPSPLPTGGTVIHATRYSSPSGAASSKIDETWAALNSLEGIRTDPEGVKESLNLEPCENPELTGQCTEYRRAVLIDEDVDKKEYDWKTVNSDEPGDPHLPNITEATSSVPEMQAHIVGSEPLTSVLKNWQRWPETTVGRLVDKYQIHSADGVDIELWRERTTGLLIKRMILSSSTILDELYVDYDSGFYSQSMLPEHYQEIPKPTFTLDEVAIQSVRNPDDVADVSDLATGDPISPKYLGNQTVISGLGTVCLDRIDTVTMRYGADQASPGLQSDVPDGALANGSLAPTTLVNAQYAMKSNGRTCAETKQLAELGAPVDSIGVRTMDPDSPQAQAIYTAELSDSTLISSPGPSGGVTGGSTYADGPPETGVEITARTLNSSLTSTNVLSNTSMITISGDFSPGTSQTLSNALVTIGS